MYTRQNDVNTSAGCMASAVVECLAYAWDSIILAWVRFPLLRKFAKIWKFTYQAPVFESRKAPAGDFRLGARLSKLEASWSRLVVF